MTHGTCALDGNHPPGSKVRRGVPSSERRAKRSERSKRAATTRWKGVGDGRRPPTSIRPGRVGAPMLGRGGEKGSWPPPDAETYDPGRKGMRSNGRLSSAERRSP